ncbi:hypothetical protein AKJ16_DCAP19410 [Drosera capensis]
MCRKEDIFLSGASTTVSGRHGLVRLCFKAGVGRRHCRVWSSMAVCACYEANSNLYGHDRARLERALMNEYHVFLVQSNFIARSIN